MIKKIKILYFWCVAFKTIIWQTLKDNHWHTIFVSFHYGDNKEGLPIRRQLVARRSTTSFDLYWENYNDI